MEVDDEFSQYRAEWETAVGRVIARAWVDPEYKQTLIADPTTALHGEGLMFPDRYVVEFYDDPAARDLHEVNFQRLVAGAGHPVDGAPQFQTFDTVAGYIE